ncbi:MAG TPA: putative zinc-binding peptidase [Amaricoccus sp.]|jgi:hypothetical protein|nr:putative zinc-binding peptidase [Amaricoccus sp.]
MRIFTCQNCGQLLHFENVVCMRCGMTLGFLPDPLTLSALELRGDRWIARADGGEWRQCANLAQANCNWMVPVGDETYCPSCALDRTIPNLEVPGNPDRWQALEAAKRRLVYALKRFGLPLSSPGSEKGLAFDFLAEANPAEPVLTGHDDGLITINIAEADSAEREKRRVELGEPYRTLLGHLRHEVGHYYWDLLVRDGGKVEASRAVFGDESVSYEEALQRHYQSGARPDWNLSYVSAYATMHPWEDFAETWTHYLHMVDTLDTAASFGLAVDPVVTTEGSAVVRFDPYRTPDFDRLVEAWVPLTVALNSLNRSMGQPDVYPFALSPPAVEKLRFVHELVRDAAA